MKNKKILLIFVISIFFTKLFAQKAPLSSDYILPQFSVTKMNENLAPEIHYAQSGPKKILEQIDVILQFEPLLYISPESKRNNSNVANILYSFTLGTSFPRDFIVSFQPTLSFFTMQYEWIGNMAIPTEIENRTATTLSFMLNLPAAFNIKFDNSRIQITAGLAGLFRTGLLSSGVNKNDSGYTGSAAGDVKKINNWFWENGRWLYASFGASWLYNITSKIKIGPIMNLYIPFTSFKEYKKPQDMIISMGVKICR